MVKTYRVRERSFINGRLCEAGALVDLHIDNPGSNLELVGGTKEEAAKPNANTNPPDLTAKGFVAKHAGSGRYRVEDANGDRVGDFTGTKEEAETEAARMNAGDPDLDDQEGNGLPDA